MKKANLLRVEDKKACLFPLDEVYMWCSIYYIHLINEIIHWWNLIKVIFNEGGKNDRFGYVGVCRSRKSVFLIWKQFIKYDHLGAFVKLYITLLVKWLLQPVCIYLMMLRCYHEWGYECIIGGGLWCWRKCCFMSGFTLLVENIVYIIYDSNIVLGHDKTWTDSAIGGEFDCLIAKKIINGSKQYIIWVYDHYNIDWRI